MRLYHFRGLKLDNCNENTGEWNGVKKQIREEREKQYSEDRPGTPLEQFVTKVNYLSFPFNDPLDKICRDVTIIFKTLLENILRELDRS